MFYQHSRAFLDLGLWGTWSLVWARESSMTSDLFLCHKNGIQTWHRRRLKPTKNLPNLWNFQFHFLPLLLCNLIFSVTYSFVDSQSFTEWNCVHQIQSREGMTPMTHRSSSWMIIYIYIYIDGSRAVVVWILAKVLKNVNVTTIMFLMSGDLTGLCLYIYLKDIVKNIHSRASNLNNLRF